MIDRFQKEVESRVIVEDDRILNGFSQILDKCDKSAIRSSCLFFSPIQLWIQNLTPERLLNHHEPVLEILKCFAPETAFQDRVEASHVLKNLDLAVQLLKKHYSDELIEDDEIDEAQDSDEGK